MTNQIRQPNMHDLLTEQEEVVNQLREKFRNTTIEFGFKKVTKFLPIHETELQNFIDGGTLKVDQLMTILVYLSFIARAKKIVVQKLEEKERFKINTHGHPEFFTTPILNTKRR